MLRVLKKEPSLTFNGRRKLGSLKIQRAKVMGKVRKKERKVGEVKGHFGVKGSQLCIPRWPPPTTPPEQNTRRSTKRRRLRGDFPAFVCRD